MVLSRAVVGAACAPRRPEVLVTRAIGMVRRAVVLAARGFVVRAVDRRVGLQYPEERETGERGQSENQSWLLAGIIRRRLDQFLDGLAADVLGEFLHGIRRGADELGKLRGLLLQAVSRGIDRPGDVAGKIGTGRELL